MLRRPPGNPPAIAATRVTASFWLTRNGASSFCIAPAHSDAEFAVKEIQRYVKRITDVELPIAKTGSAAGCIELQVDPAGPDIHISFSTAPKQPPSSRGATRRGDPASGRDGRLDCHGGLSPPRNDGTGKAPVATSDTGPGHIRIAGRDRFHLLYAAYVFLENLGCRWFAPDYGFYGEAGGAVVPRVADIALEPFELQQSATFTYRKKYVEEGRSHDLDSLRQLIDWMPRVGLNTFVCPIDWCHQGRAVWDNWRAELTPELTRRGIRIEVGGHGYENFLSAQELAEHPDWAGLRPDNSRELDPTKRTFCTTNDTAVAHFKSNVEAFLRAHPEIDIFDCWPPDTRDWCVCHTCRAAGPIPDRHAALVNEVATIAKQVRPDLRVSFPAYYEPTTPPANVKLTDVMVDFCPITRSYQSAIFDSDNKTNRFYAHRLRAWFETKNFDGTVCAYTYYRKYAWRSLPILLPHLIARELRFYAQRGVDGIGSYSEPADWWTYELQHYVIARCSWNAAVEVDALLNDYVRYRYGPAAAPIRKLIVALGDFLPDVARIPGTELHPDTSTPHDIYEFWDPAAGVTAPFTEQVETCRQNLAAAKELAASDSAIQDRLSRWQILIDYVGLEVQARGLAIALAQRATGGFLSRYQQVMEEMQRLAIANSENGLILHDEWADYAPDRL